MDGIASFSRAETLVHLLGRRYIKRGRSLCREGGKPNETGSSFLQLDKKTDDLEDVGRFFNAINAFRGDVRHEESIGGRKVCVLIGNRKDVRSVDTCLVCARDVYHVPLQPLFEITCVYMPDRQLVRAAPITRSVGTLQEEDGSIARLITSYKVLSISQADGECDFNGFHHHTFK